MFAVLLLATSSSQLSAETRESTSPVMTRTPMPMELEHTTTFRQRSKPVLASRLLDEMEEETHWSHHGYGRMELTRQRSIDGEHSISLVAPTMSSKPTAGRPLGTAVVRRTFSQENWSEYNRLSFWVYPSQPGAQVISMGIVLRVAQDPAIDSPYESEVFHYFLLKHQQWNHILWEIPHLIRHKVEAIEFHYRIHGREPGDTPFARFDIDHLELQRVEQDYYEGWAVAPGRIATSHTGYAPGAKKTAISSTVTGTIFQLLHTETGEIVLTNPVQEVHAPLGDFQLMDFSDVREPGSYLIRAEGAAGPPIRVQHNIWLETIWKTVNFFYSERCGMEIPGIHAICHSDLRTAHANKQIIINGGWHDAGDLSQGLTNTAEATQVMFRLAEHLHELDTALAARLTEEARWGLEWLLKTRFGDGYRSVWATMDLWTDGILGNMDDVVWAARNSPHGNLLAAAAEASAGRILRPQEPRLAAQALRAAEEDWRFATEAILANNLQTAAFAVNAALELYQATGETSYASAAVEHGNTIVHCQQKVYTSWRLPVAGFFYTTPDKQRIVHYSHDSHEQAPLVALSRLCEALPDHPDWVKWYYSVVLYSEYLRTVSSINEPYFIPPASIYSIRESRDPEFLAQVKNGLPLGKTHFLRRLPVWGSQTYRGNNAVLLSQVNALSIVGRLRNDPSLLDLARSGMEWIVGKNPFAQSLMAGEGYDGQPLYSPTSGDIVGALPVGIKTYFNRDVPFWPSDNQSCYKEVWVHPAIRWLSLMNNMAEFSEHSEAGIGDGPRGNVSERLMFSLSQETSPDGTVSITVTASGAESMHYSIRASNLHSDEFEGRMVLLPNQQTSKVWTAKMKSIDEPWIAVFIPNHDLSQHQEVFGSTQAQEVDGRTRLFYWPRDAIEVNGRDGQSTKSTPPPSKPSDTADDPMSLATKADTTLLPNAHEPTRPGIAVNLTEDSSNAISIKLVYVPAGQFLMGSPNTERGAFPEAEEIREVTISQPFFIGMHEVTQAEWEAVMGDNPAQYHGKPDHPVESVAWEQCASFCNRLSRSSGYGPVYDESSWTRTPEANGFRLPTEAEWEYACRAGSSTRFSFGDALDAADAGDLFSKTLDQHLWWRGNNTSLFGTKPVGAKAANPWGVHGMHGNVSEWCEDYWVTERGPGPLVDPHGPRTGSSHAIRGGYFGSYARYCRSASRYCDAGDHYGDYDFVGFRILLPASAEQMNSVHTSAAK